MVLRKRILKITAFMIVAMLLFMLVSRMLLCTAISTEMHIRGFYKEPENSLDVGVIGCSEVYADYSSPLVYDECGITSYGLAYEGAPGIMYSSMIDTFLERQDPQLLVVEINGFFYDETYMYEEGRIRRWTDNMDRGKIWKKTVDENVAPEDRMSFYMPIIKYHSGWTRWEELLSTWYHRARMRTFEVSPMKCFGTHTVSSTEIVTADVENHPITDVGLEEFEKLLEHCNDEGIENILFLWAPHYVPLEDRSRDEIARMISEHGYDFLNCDEKLDEIGIDPDTDYYNSEHLNIFGNEKFSKYMAHYMMDNYSIKTTHTEEVDKLWEECVEYSVDKYAILKERTLQNEDLVYSEYSNYDDKMRQFIENFKKTFHLTESHDDI